MKALFILIISWGVFLNPIQKTSQPVINKKIISFCDKNIGKKVGKGECWDLASEALKDAQANWTPPYDFGKEINDNKEEVFAGDIIQFEGANIVYPDKSWQGFAKHTAIIYKTKEKKQYTIAEQNSNGKRYVILTDIDLNYLKKGKYQIYRPQ